MRLPILLDPRRSFAAKLVAALLATVGLMLAAMLLVVRSETEGQIALVTDRAVERAHEGFEASEARRLEQLAVRIRSFTGGPRGFALVEEAILTRDTAWLALEVGYRLEQIEFEQNSLTVLVDAAGIPRPVTPRNVARFALEIAPLWRWGDPTFLPVSVGDAWTAGPRTLLRSISHIVRDDVRPLLGRVAAPTLVIWGERDNWVPVQHALELRRSIPEASLVILRGAAHMPMVDRPEAFNRLVERFLDGEAVGS